MSAPPPPPPPAVAPVPELPAGPRLPQSRTSTFLTKLIEPQPQRRTTSLFRLMNPELFIERTAKVSPSAWLVTGMVGFAFVTIAYTQWEYTQTTQKVEQTASKNKADAREQRKEIIRREIDREEANGVRR